MEVETTSEEIKMLIKSLHADCESGMGGTCDLVPLLKAVLGLDEFKSMCAFLGKEISGYRPSVIETLAMIFCSGIKVGYQIGRPELVPLGVERKL